MIPVRTYEILQDQSICFLIKQNLKLFGFHNSTLTLERFFRAFFCPCFVLILAEHCCVSKPHFFGQWSAILTITLVVFCRISCFLWSGNKDLLPYNRGEVVTVKCWKCFAEYVDFVEIRRFYKCNPICSSDNEYANKYF